MKYIPYYEPKGLYHQFIGDLTGQELIKIAEKIHISETFSRLEYVISDYLEITSIEMTEDEAEHLAGIDAISTKYANPKLCVAVVATDQILLQLAEIYSKTAAELRPAYDTKTFSSVEEARAWLKSKELL